MASSLPTLSEVRPFCWDALVHSLWKWMYGAEKSTVGQRPSGSQILYNIGSRVHFNHIISSSADGLLGSFQSSDKCLNEPFGWDPRSLIAVISEYSIFEEQSWANLLFSSLIICAPSCTLYISKILNENKSLGHIHKVNASIHHSKEVSTYNPLQDGSRQLNKHYCAWMSQAARTICLFTDGLWTSLGW